MPEMRASGWPLETPDVENPATFPEVVDRDVENPTRVSVNPVATSPAPFVADLGDECGPGEPGTPIDAALFEAVEAYVDAGDRAARDEAVESAQTNAQTLDGILETRLKAYADGKASEEATAKADAAQSAAEAHADEGDAALQAQVDSIVETGTAAMQTSTVEAIVGGTPASEVGDAGFAERLAVERLWQSVEAKVEEARKAVLLAAHPVGSYYWSAEATDPSELFGGEWEQVKDVFVWAKGDGDEVGATGGARTVALTTAQMPAHTHTGPSHYHSVSKNAVHVIATRNGQFVTGTQGSLLGIGGAANATNYPAGYSLSGFAGGSGSNFYNAPKGPVYASNENSFNTASSGTGATGSTGSGSAHENMPPYVAAYCWRRTA